MANQLAEWLEVKDDARDLIEKVWSRQRPNEWPLELVSGVIVDIGMACEDTLSNADAEHPQWRNPNANEWLAGAELPCVFEEHFGRRPGVSRVHDP